MSYFFPNGINPAYNRTNFPILPGSYAVAGSAAFAGANTGNGNKHVLSLINSIRKHRGTIFSSNCV